MLERLNNILRARKQNDKGFSLVELAVVIVIIGILVAIAVPIFANMQAAATTAKDEANAANGAAMVATQVALGVTSAETIQDELDKLDAAVTLSKPESGAVDLENYCVTAGTGGVSKGPDC